MSSRRELAAMLGDVALFGQCTKRSLATIARHLETVRVPAGSAIVEEGARGDAFFVVLAGEAGVEVDGVVEAKLGPGDYFGELALLDPAPRSATVRAITEVELAVLGARMFRTLAREYPDLSEKLLSGLARELRDARAASRRASA